MAIAPAMTRDKTIREDGAADFEALNLKSELSISGNEYSAVSQRWILGNGNVESWSARDLRMVWCKSAQMSQGSSDIHDAVYVVGTLDPTCVKVGMATDPVSRLAQLQTGNHEKLYLHRVFWTLKPEAARDLERTSHSFLGRKSKRLVGEWFDCTPAIAHDTIINACRTLVLGFCAITPHGPLDVKVEKII